MRHSALYTLVFAGVVCLVCSVLVTVSTVSLRARQEENFRIDKQEKVLAVAGLTQPGEKPDAATVTKLYNTHVHPRLVDMKTGEYAPNEEELLKTYDLQKAMSTPSTSEPAPANPAQVKRVPNYGIVYEVTGEDGKVDTIVLPVQGQGLWSTLYGYLALKSDVDTIQGLTFYKQEETPGLGGEVDNPKWKALWPGRKAFGDDFNVKIAVIKGKAGPPSEAPYSVDGLSGATITSNGVTHLLHFWLGENGYVAYLKKFREAHSQAA